MVNIKPLWILDFYVSEAWQREGHGKHLFDCVLEDEKIEPKNLAYDRPSHKFLSFLNKHFGLWDYYPQNNNFVVFNQYFEKLRDDKLVKAQAVTNYSFNQNSYNPYGTSSSMIRDKQRKGQGVFSVLGSQMMQRSETAYDKRDHSAYQRFQGILGFYL